MGSPGGNPHVPTVHGSTQSCCDRTLIAVLLASCHLSGSPPQTNGRRQVVRLSVAFDLIKDAGLQLVAWTLLARPRFRAGGFKASLMGSYPTYCGPVLSSDGELRAEWLHI